MRSLKVLFVVLIALGFLYMSCAKQPEPVSESNLGEKLVRQLWADLETNNIEAIEKMIAPGFQSIHQDGARDCAQEIELIKNLDLGEYTLSDFKVTENGPVIVVSYFVSVQETIEGERLSSEPAARLSVFTKIEDEWQWLAHANLKSLK